MAVMGTTTCNRPHRPYSYEYVGSVVSVSSFSPSDSDGCLHRSESSSERVYKRLIMLKRLYTRTASPVDLLGSRMSLDITESAID